MTPTFFHSALSDVRWPAVPGPVAARLLALQYQLDRSQWWNADDVCRAQYVQLETLLAHAAGTVAFYQRRFQEAGLDPRSFDTGRDWSKLPILARRDVQESGNLLLSSERPASHGRTHKVQTSGSSGSPVRVFGTELTQLFWLALTLRHHLWHEADFRGKLATIRYAAGGRGIYPAVVSQPSWGGALQPLLPTGPALLLNVATPIEQQALWLQTESPDYLITYPSNLAALVKHCEANDIRLGSLRNVQTIGEVVQPELRAACRSVLGVGLIDMYSTQEVGYIALQCPLSGAYHIQSETVFVEILDDAGRACEPGETGQVVVTSLHNFAMPLIRYAIGDYATVGGPCGCGRGLPVISRIMGRTRNMLTRPDGQRVWPYFGGDKFREVAPVSQYRLVQKSVRQLELTVVAMRPLSADEEHDLRALMLKNLGAPFEIAFSYAPAIARSAGGKYEDFRSEIAP